MSSGYENIRQPPRMPPPEDIVVHNPFQMELDAKPAFAQPARGNNNIRNLIDRLRQRPQQVAPAPPQQAPAEPKSVLRRE